jgi:hypothetical protein
VNRKNPAHHFRPENEGPVRFPDYGSAALFTMLPRVFYCSRELPPDHILLRLVTPAHFHFLNFDRCGKIAANAPIHAVIIPSMDASIVGLFSNPPEDVDVGCTVVTGAGVTID